MVHFGETILAAVFAANAIKGANRCVAAPLVISELYAVVGHEGAAPVWDPGKQVAQKPGGDHLCRFLMESGMDVFAGADDDSTELQHATLGVNLRHDNMEIADGIFPECHFHPSTALLIWNTADAMLQKATQPQGSRKKWLHALQRIPRITLPKTVVSPNPDAQGFINGQQNLGARIPRTRRRIMNNIPLILLGRRHFADAECLQKKPSGVFTILYLQTSDLLLCGRSM